MKKQTKTTKPVRENLTAWKEAVSKGKIDSNRHPSDIKIARIKRGYEQSRISKALKIASPTYTMIERGTLSVTPVRANQIARIVGVRVEELFKTYDKNPARLIATHRKSGR